MDVLAGLNEAQRQAVTFDRGPLAVLAGPGTGKTRVIIHRVARLIADGVEPEKIVAVTFTVKAAEQMRTKLADLLGSMGHSASIAQRVNVHTFHGLGRRLVNRFPDMLGLPGKIDLIDEPQQRRLLRELIAQHRILPEAVGEGREALVEQAEAYLDLWTDAGLSAREALVWAAKWAKTLDQTKPKDADGELKLAADRALQRRFAEFARLAEHYEAARRDRGWCSFGDLIVLPCMMLEKSAAVGAIVRSDYRHWVVDEFQDVNAAQIRLLSLLAPTKGQHGAGDDPDVCVVGDDDQAIYGFRGADDRAFQKFAKLYPEHEQVQLVENYRSRPGIVRVANAVITGATERFAPNKKAEPSAQQREDESKLPRQGTPAVEYIKLADHTDDAMMIAAMVLTDRAANPGKAWKDYAVIARSHGDLDRAALALEVEGIPVSRRRGRGWRDDEGVKDVLAWVALLLNDRDVTSARRLLLRPPARLDLLKLGEWERTYLAARSRIVSGLEEAVDPGPYLSWLLASPASAEVAVARTAEFERALREAAAHERADTTLMRIIRLTGAAHAELLPPTARASRVLSLVKLLRLARTIQPRLQEPGDLAAFIEYFEDLPEKSDGVDPSERVDEAAADDEGAEQGGGGGVQLTTAHSSKGLEFKTVFVQRVSPNANYGFPSTAVDEALPMPKGLIDRAGDTRDAKSRTLDEERRLFYVACTRAEQRLVLLARWTAKPSTSTSFIDELVRTPREPDLVVTRTSEDVLREAAVAGVKLSVRDAMDEGQTDLKRSRDWLDALAQRRSQIHLEATLALESVDREGVTGKQIGEAASRAAMATAQLAVLGFVARRHAVPDELVKLAGSDVVDEMQAWASTVRDRLETEHGEDGDEGFGAAAAKQLFKPMKAPLRLSYSMIDAYQRCPRCMYLKYGLGLPDEAREVTAMGTLVHEVLKRFFEQWRDADAEGRSKPGLDELLAMGRKAFAQAQQAHIETEPGDRETMLAQLATAFTKLHDPDAQIIELEREVTFDYPHNDTVHTLTAKIDRLDQLDDGGVRIVDYKTGKDWDKLSTPEAGDLQFGVYALAVTHLLGTPSPAGRAEYWLLASGKRGVLDLASLNTKSVAKKIDKAIDGMLAGHWDSAKDCEGPCSWLSKDGA